MCTVKVCPFKHPITWLKQKWIQRKYKNWQSINFPEDSSHENGNYLCLCVKCGNTFTGYKARFLCRLCKNSETNDNKSTSN